MIQQMTKLNVSDNSGAKIVKCLKVLGGFKKKIATLGDIIIVSVQVLRNKLKKNSKVKKKELYKAVVIWTKLNTKTKIGLKNLFKNNAVILLNKQGNPIGTWILTPLPFFFKKRKFQKFINISKGLI